MPANLIIMLVTLVTFIANGIFTQWLWIVIKYAI